MSDTYDPFERAAERTRRSVLAKRPESAVSRVLDALGLGMAREAVRVGSIPRRMVEAAGITDPELRTEALRGLGGELTGTAVETMFGPKGSRGVARAAIIGSVSGKGADLASKIKSKLPFDWTAKEIGKTGEFQLVDHLGNPAGVLKEFPQSKYPFSIEYGGKSQPAKDIGEVHGLAHKIAMKEELKAAKAFEKAIEDFQPAGYQTQVYASDPPAKQTLADLGFNPAWTPENPVGKPLWQIAKEEKAAFGGARTGRYPGGEREYMASLPAELTNTDRELARILGGYTTPAYRGRRGTLPRRIDEAGFERPIFSTAEPSLAELYARGGSHADPESLVLGAGQIQPLYLNIKDYLVRDVKGANWSDVQRHIFREAERKKAPGVVFHNIYDEPSTMSYNSILGAPQTVYATFDPTTRKSMFARRFDPSSPDILEARIAGRGVPAPRAEEQSEADKARTLNGLLDRVLGGAGAP